MLHPPIEVQQFGPVGVDDLAYAQQPILQELPGGRRLAANVEFVRFGHGRPVEIAFGHWLAHVGVDIASMPHEPPVFGAVVRCGEMQPMAFRSLAQFAEDVAMRPHIVGVPAGQFTAVHLEAVMMFGYGHVVPGAGFAEQVEPGVGVEAFGGEQGDEILVPEVLLRTVCGAMMIEFRVAFDVHVARIPFVAVFGNGVKTPVGEDAELGVGEPFRSLRIAQRCPAIVVWSGADDRLDGIEIHH